MINSGENSPALTLAYGINLLRASDAAFQLNNETATLVLSAPFGAGTTAHANLGWLRDRGDHQTSTTWNLAIETHLSDSLEAGAEWCSDDRLRPWGGIGLRWLLTEQFSLNTSFAARVGEGSERLVMVGAKLGF